MFLSNDSKSVEGSVFKYEPIKGYPEVKDLLESWGQAVVETNYDRLLTQYADESVLIPTLSNMKRESASSRRYYFEGFSPNVTQVRWHWGKASWQEHHGVVTVSGEYDFLMVDKTVTRAQFVFNVVDGKIVTHMSRSLPNT